MVNENMSKEYRKRKRKRKKKHVGRWPYATEYLHSAFSR